RAQAGTGNQRRDTAGDPAIVGEHCPAIGRAHCGRGVDPSKIESDTGYADRRHRKSNRCRCERWQSMIGTRATILVVGDDDAGRYLKARVLRSRGYQVSEASSGGAAIEHCCATAPDLVLLDVMLPDINGFEVGRRIKVTHPGVAVLQTSAAITSSHD